MAYVRYAGSILLMLLILVVAVLCLPFLILGIAWGCSSTAFAAGRHLIVNAIVNKGQGKALDRYANRFKRGAGVVFFCLMAQSAFAQTITFDVGRAYSIPEGAWVVGQTVGIEHTLKGMTISAARVFRAGETRFGCWREFEIGRLSLSSGADYYRYDGNGYDWSWSSGVRFRVR